MIESSNNKDIEFCKFFSRVSSFFVISVGIIVLLGWQFNIAFLKSILPNYPTMNPVTAVMFLLLGSSLLIHQFPYSKLSRLAANMAAFMVLTVALCRLAAVLGGAHSNPDQILFTSRLGHSHIAINTAFNFLILSICLLTLHQSRNPYRHFLNILTITISSIAILGYLYCSQELFKLPSFASMSVNTAITFLILSMGIICFEPDYGVMYYWTNKRMSGEMFRRIVPLSFSVLILLGWVRIQTARFNMVSVELGILFLISAIAILFFGLICYVSFILERLDSQRQKKTEESIEIAQRLNLATHSAKIGVWQWDITTNALVWDDWMYKLYGIKSSDFSGAYDAWENGIYPDDKKKAVQELLDGVDGKKDFDTEFRVLWPDKSIHHIRAHGLVTRDHQGKPVKMIGVNWDITDSKKAQEVIIEAEERFRLLIEGVKDYAIFMLDPNGYVLTWNLGAERFKGYKEHEIVGKHFSIFYTQEDIKRGHPNHELELARNSGVYFEEGIRIRKDGKPFWSHVLITAIRDKDGKLTGFSKITRDISKEKENRDKIELLSAYQKAILENAGFAIITGDKDGLITSFNPAAERMLGYSAEETIGRLTPAVFHDKDEVFQRAKEFSEELKEEVRPGFETFVIKAIKGLPNTHEWIYVRKDGSHLTVLLSITGLKDVEGKIFGFLGVASDISELKKTQRNLIEKQRELQDQKNALDQHSIVAITDVSGKITYVNDKFCEISKFSKEELIGQDHRIVNSGYHSKEFIRGLWRTIANGDVWAGEIRNKAKDGSFYWVNTTIIPFLNEQSKPYQYVAVRTDITDRKAQEIEILEKSQELERSNKELEQFAYVASHDLQEPLRMVASFTQLLERKYKDKLDDKAQEYINFAVDGAKRMQGLIDDLLTFSKTGLKDVPKSTVDLNKVCQHVIRDLGVLISESNAIVEIGLMPEIYANETQMNQLFLNLIGNGLKYKSERSPIIKVDVQKIGEGQWQFSVTDNGIGIDKQYFNKLFVIFQRLHTRKEYKGTGIGLALCKKIVENYNGRIWVESIVGHGTTFYFTLINEEVKK